MSVKKIYQVELPETDEVTPFIYRVEEGQGVIWRDAKKIVRKWFLDQARQLRSLTEAQFIKREQDAALIQNATVSDTSGQAT